MIEGITILNQTEITEMGLWSLLVGVLAFIIVIFFIGAMAKFEAWSAVLGGVVGFIVLVSIFASSVEPTGRYRYECTIDKSVSMTEVYEKYEVVEQRGDIWVLEDKE